jgi:hypothetical protein
MTGTILGTTGNNLRKIQLPIPWPEVGRMYSLIVIRSLDPRDCVDRCSQFKKQKKKQGF